MKRFLEFFKSAIKFVSNLIDKAFSFVKSLKRNKTRKPIQNETIKQIVSEVSFTTESVSLEANGQFAIQHMSNSELYEKRTGINAVDAVNDFLKRIGFLKEFKSRCGPDGIKQYCLYYQIDQFFGKTNVDELESAYNDVSKNFIIIISQINSIVSNGVDISNQMIITSEDFWKFGNFASVFVDSKDVAEWVLENYHNDNSDTIGKDSIKACRAFKKTVSTNMAAVQGAIKYVNSIQTNNFSNLRTCLTEFSKITSDVLKCLSTTINTAVNVEWLYNRLDELFT